MKDLLTILDTMDIPIHEYEYIPTPWEEEMVRMGARLEQVIEITEIRVAPDEYEDEVWRVCALPWTSPAYRNIKGEVCSRVDNLDMQIPDPVFS